MSKHNFTALTTFRGWSDEEDKWVYGNLFITNDEQVYILPKATLWITEDDGVRFRSVYRAYKVYSDSIGVYTGKDDKDGNSIFCGVAGAKYGGDILTGHGYYEYSVVFDGEIILRHQDGKWGPLYRLYDDDMDELREMLSVAKSQWEDDLKATNEA